MSNKGSETKSRLCFGDFVFDEDGQRLLRDGNLVRLAPQPLSLLRLFLRSRGRLVTRAEVQEHLWPDQVVDFNQGMGFCLRKLREALGDSAQDPTYVETVPRLGFRFLAAVDRVVAQEPKPAKAKDLVATERITASPAVFSRPSVGGAAWLGGALLVSAVIAWMLSREFVANPASPSAGGAAVASQAMFRVIGAPPSETEQLQIWQVLAQELPQRLRENLGGMNGTLEVSLVAPQRRLAPQELALADQSRSPSSMSQRLRVRVRAADRPQITVELDIPRDISLSVLAEDLSRELARQLVLPHHPDTASREEVVTIDRT